MRKTRGKNSTSTRQVNNKITEHFFLLWIIISSSSFLLLAPILRLRPLRLAEEHLVRDLTLPVLSFFRVFYHRHQPSSRLSFFTFLSLRHPFLQKNRTARSPRVLPSGTLQRRARPVRLDRPPSKPGKGPDPSSDPPLAAAAAGRGREGDAAAGAGVRGRRRRSREILVSFFVFVEKKRNESERGIQGDDERGTGEQIERVGVLTTEKKEKKKKKKKKRKIFVSLVARDWGVGKGLKKKKKRYSSALLSPHWRKDRSKFQCACAELDVLHAQKTRDCLFSKGSAGERRRRIPLLTASASPGVDLAAIERRGSALALCCCCCCCCGLAIAEEREEETSVGVVVCIVGKYIPKQAKRKRERRERRARKKNSALKMQRRKLSPLHFHRLTFRLRNSPFPSSSFKNRSSHVRRAGASLLLLRVSLSCLCASSWGSLPVEGVDGEVEAAQRPRDAPERTRLLRTKKPLRRCLLSRSPSFKLPARGLRFDQTLHLTRLPTPRKPVRNNFTFS